MRPLTILSGLLFLAILFPACAKKEKAVVVDFAKPESKFSYAIGQEMGNSLKEIKGKIDIPTLVKGMEDQLGGKKPVMTEQEQAQIKQEVFMSLQKEKGEAGLLAENKFFAENKTKPGVITTQSGLQYIVLQEGKGPKPKATDNVTVHYQGTLLDGKEFDSSYKRGEPVTFPLNGVIPGWTEGVQLMSVGAKYKFFIPSKLGYGERGAGGAIPPNATLVFEVELLKIGAPSK